MNFKEFLEKMVEFSDEYFGKDYEKSMPMSKKLE
jgi:hypothetical protein